MNEKTSGITVALGALWGVVAAIMVVLQTINNMAPYALVFSDELTFSNHARYGAFSDSPISSYVYFAIYSATNACGDSFLSCARIINSLFLIASIPFLYGVARQFVGRGGSAVFSLSPLLAPTNTYSMYFMAESAYFFAFWVVTWFVLRERQQPTFASAAITGGLLGLASLIKPHAIFLLPAMLICSGMMSRSRSTIAMRDIVIRMALIVVAFAATKFGVSYALAGPSGLTVFGPLYVSVARSSVANVSSPSGFLEDSFVLLFGHFVSISLLAGLPLAVVVQTIYCHIREARLALQENAEKSDMRDIALYSALVLFSLIVISVGFSASIAYSGPYESATRLHLRYYNFSLPLLALIAMVSSKEAAIATSLKTRFVLASPFVVAIIWSAIYGMKPYSANFVDSPELQGFLGGRFGFVVLTMFLLTAMFTWIRSPTKGAKIYIALFLPALIVFSNVYVVKSQRAAVQADVFARAGLVARHYLSDDDRKSLLVIGWSPAGVQKALFYIDSRLASARVLAQGATLKSTELDAKKSWVLIIGDSPSLVDGLTAVISAQNFVLARTRR